MDVKVYHINLGYACFGIVTLNGKVTAAPPIATWMTGKSLQEIKPWLVKKKAKVKECEINNKI